MTNSARLLFGLVVVLLFVQINTNQLTSSSRAEELKLINKLRLEIEEFKKNLTNFYNYSIICGGKAYESRADRAFTDNTIPSKFKSFAFSTYLKPELRLNKCPKWSNNIETVPRSGGMDMLSIPENTKPGQKVYLLLAIDPESEPIYYFIRKAESETDESDEIIFRVNVIRMGSNWLGEVVLDKELDYEKKQSYNYLTYAYDGSNLLEKYSIIEITDVDDEKPVINLDHANYNVQNKQFEFRTFENMSIGEVVNSNQRILFTDIDTQNSQLTIRLTNLESGISDSPFSLNNHGELRLISSLDYETQKEYLLKLQVRDTSGGIAEEIIKIEILDVPDLPPKFIEPKNLNHESKTQTNFYTNQIDLNEDGYVLFYEKKTGPIFNITAISQNKEPLGVIKYELLENLNPNYLNGYFELRQSTNDTWYLECLREISLNDKEEEYLQFIIRATESNESKSLFSDKKVTVKIVNGDMCLPAFDKNVYEFDVVENVKQLIEPIFIYDCDHGINGRIFLSTTNADFSFKMNEVYRYSKLGIEMSKSYDYEENLTINGHQIEFEIIARGSNQSINRFETRALVRINILDVNEFMPRFVQPAPAYFVKDGIPTQQQQRIFLYNVAEGRDFNLDVLAEDQDKGGDAELFYFCRYLHPDDTFTILHSYNSSSRVFSVKVPGRYFDATSKIPIAFAVFVEDSKDEPKLRNEIIIYLRPQSVEQKAAYFEFAQYEFKLKENPINYQTFTLKLINDNLSMSKIMLEELWDPLNLLLPDYEESLISQKDMINLLENEKLDNDAEQDITNELLVLLYPTDSNVDFDELYVKNNYSDVYVYKLRVKLTEKPELYNDVTVYFKLVDSNDNKPRISNFDLNKENSYFNSSLNQDFAPNTLININDTHFIPQISDLDFSADFGLRSLYFKVNDSRFYIDNEFMSAELEHQDNKALSLLIRVLTSPENINKQSEPVIWLNVTCEDNYFNRKLNRANNLNSHWSLSFLIKLNIVDSILDQNTELFDHSEYTFRIDERWTGQIGRIGRENKIQIKYKLEGHSQEHTQLLDEYFEIKENILFLKKQVDFEMGQHFFNFTFWALPLTGTAKFKTNVVVLVNDLNDEKPVFSNNEYKILLTDKNKKSGNIIGQIYATDMDKQDWFNGISFNSSSDKFSLEKIQENKDHFLQGVLIKLAVDLTEEEYSFEVKAVDTFGNSEITKVIVMIENQQPFTELKWSEEPYNVLVKENSPSGTSVVKVSISPVDLLSKKYKIGYKIIGLNEYYKMDEITGEILTGYKTIDREDLSSYEQSKQTLVFIQAYLTIDSTTYWSTLNTVNIQIVDINDESPVFIHPTDNQTQILRYKPDIMYTFLATDQDLNDTIKYSLHDQLLVFSNSQINLPFKVDPSTGILSFEFKDLSNDEYLMLLRLDADLVRIRLTVKATDSSEKSTSCHLFIDFSIYRLIKKTNKTELAHLTPITYKLEPKNSQVEKLNDTVYSIEESLLPNTIIADLNSYLGKSDTRVKMSENLKIIPLKNDSINPDLYFRYDQVTSGLKLIRKLDYDVVKNLSLSLVDDDDFRIDVELVVKDTNDKQPELQLDEQEQNKYGENLVVVSIDRLDQYVQSISRVISSTPLPPKQSFPAIPELNLPERIFNTTGLNLNPELTANKEHLNSFDNIKTLKAYKIIDPDRENNFSVQFVQNATSEAIIRAFNVFTNGTHVLFEKSNRTTAEDEANLDESEQNRFKIELSDGLNRKQFSGELFKIDGRQLQRLTTFLPINGRYRAAVYKSSVQSTKINLEPMIQIENQFPYDIHVGVEGKHSKYFDVTPKVVKSTTHNFGPTEVVLSLKDSLEKYEDDLIGMVALDFSIALRTSNDYVNKLLKTIGTLKVKIDLKNENKYEPKIESIWPESGIIYLDEGFYSNQEIAGIQAYDRDRGDPGRLEYFLIGNSNLLQINQTTGTVYLNGIMDAESEQSIVFFCYARDLAPAPFGRNSELKRFEIMIKDLNEYKPVLQPGLTSLALKETNETSPELNVINEFRYDCYDRDLDSPLEISLDSIRYVSKHDSFDYLDESKTNSNQLQIKDLFKLVYENTTLSKNYKSAYLAYTNKLDYEKLYRPSETLIRIDVSCSDGKYESKSKLLIKVEDLNDNPPRFKEKNLLVHKNESNLLETIVRVEAIDMDQSAQFGNQSLKFKINKCAPNIYEIYIDERTGDISSKLLLDLDTEEIIKKRKEIANQELDLSEQIEFLTNYNKIVCDISVFDGSLYTAPNELSLNDSMSLTILINDVNDNPPDIGLDKQGENLIEIKEGEQTRGAILQKISVFDKDGAGELECLFGTGFKTSDPFEFRTSLDRNDPHTTWCILKVRDDMIVDYDIVRKSIYFLELVVVDNKPPAVYPNSGVSRAQIRIRVIPVNNKPPLFVNGNEETFYVLDTVRPGTLIGTVLATDMENPNPDRLFYKFDKYLPTKAYEKFDLKPSLNSTNSYWGSVGIFTKGKLEVNESPYFLTVIAYDGPSELKDTLSSRKIIKVYVLNKGSMTVWVNVTTGLPVEYYSVSLEEEQPAGSFVVQIRANIPDSYQSTSVLSDQAVYSILPDNEETNLTNPYYKINPITGEITTTGKRIDFEEKDLDSIRLIRNIKIKATSPDGFFTYVTHVSINILDLNDNKPKFEIRDYKFCVVENTNQVTKIGTVRAFDADSGVNSQLKYKIDNDLFSINEITGEISVLTGHKIDRELNQTIRVQVTAYDIDDLEDTIDLDICVLDLNDNTPQFDLNTQKEFTIEENSSEFRIQLNASDPDLAQNGSLIFFLDKSLNSIDVSQKFKIEPLSGLVELISPLDFESKSEYKLVLTCSDNGIPEKLKSNIELVLKLIDLNDNAPKFTLSSLNKAKVRVNEATSPGSSITRVEAIDLDTSELFKQVDYQINSIYAVRSGELVKLESGLFTIDSNGEIHLGKDSQLDYQKDKEYLIELQALDKDKPEFTDYYKLTIQVEPSNDKIPFFEHSNGGQKQTTLYRRSLAESRENDYVVDIVKAVDPNQYGIRYYLDSVEEINSNNQSTPVEDDLFSVGAEDGAVKTRKTRSFYSGDSYRLNIRAVSKLSDKLNSTTVLLVKVDSNADSLFEERVLEISIDENLPGGSMITKLNPKSADRTLRYKLNSEYSTPVDLYSKWFKVDYTTGYIRTNDAAQIDCEVANEILLSIDVIDESKSKDVLENIIIKVKINDLNDNVPVFDMNYVYEPIITEDNNYSIGLDRVITKFKAIDLDRTEKYSAIQYRIESIENMPSNSFKLISQSNGEIDLVKAKNTHLDRDDPSIGSKKKLIIIAENKFDTSKFTRKEFIINLIDLNDNAPILLDNEPETTISLSENYRLSEKFYQVKAFDKDEPNSVNSELIYDIAEKVTNIQIDPQGYLYLTGELDYETQKEIVLNINIFDKSTKPLTTTKKLIIKVLNVNDNYPKFEQLPNESCLLSLSENLEPKILFKFKASDLDAHLGDFNFEITSLKTLNPKAEIKNDLFSIDAKTGELRLIGQLDRESVDNYELRINLKDQEINGIRLETNLDCKIKVLDVNDNSPRFIDSLKTNFKILPLVNERTLIGYFAANDLDLGMNASIEYSLVDNKNNLFEIDSNSYLFLNLKKFSKEKNHDLDDLFNLEIIARDRGVPTRLESSLKITVQIDPNYFMFDQQKMDKLDLQTPDLVYLQENSAEGTRVGQVKVLNAFKAIIDDSKQNQNRIIDLKFSLLTCNETFRIDEKTGLVEVLNQTKLDYERFKEFLLTVEAKEVQEMSSFSKRRLGTSSFMVKLINTNDNPVVFNREVYETNLFENQKHLPFELNLNELIQLSDADLETTKTTALNQLNPIDLRLSEPDSSSFRLVQLTPLLYKLESIEKFDYEFKKVYEFTLNAWDGKFKSSARVKVNILDENDNKPYFEKEEYSFAIDENSPMNTQIGLVKGLDLDQTEENSLILYKITNTQENVFGLNEKTGLLFVRDSDRLDREKVDYFELTIIAYNPNKPEYYDTTRVRINLNDLNDQAPKFEHSVVRVNIREKFTALPRLLAKLHAVDNDLGDNGTVHYFIQSVNSQRYEFSFDENSNRTDFYLDKENGKLYLNSYLDADSSSIDKSFEIKIVARDLGGNEDESLVLINLIDVNDHAPIVVNSNQKEFSFDENVLHTQHLFEINAYDPDFRQSRIQYFIDQDLSDDWSFFRIDHLSGKVYTDIRFDYETKNEYNLRILCKDSGIMIENDLELNEMGLVNDMARSSKFELTTEIKLRIKVNDLDDNEPEFSKMEKDYVVDMSENLEPGSIITVLPIARDRDTLPENTMVRYYITNSLEDGKFRLNETTGELILVDELERKEKNFYEFNIRATSKNYHEMLQTQAKENELSILVLKLNVVKDKLFIEFDEQNYYVSVQLNEEQTKDAEHVQYKFENLETKTSSKSLVNNDLIKKSAIFYSKSHLIKRKLKRNVKFNIEMLQIIRSNEKIATKMPLSLVNRLNHSHVDEYLNSSEYFSRMNHLFSIDEVNGKIYANRDFMRKEGYQTGDRFVLTVSALSINMYSDETENTLTQLTVRLTDKDYSFIMPLKRVDVQEILFECLNPLKAKYIPRILEADGVKIAIQDLVPIKSLLTGETSHNLVLQVEAKQEHKTLDLDLFVNLWKNYSISNRFFNEFNGGLIDRRPVSNARMGQPFDLYDLSRPFYLSWLFWLLAIIGILLIVILIFFVFCIKITRKQHKKNKKPGIIIEYPPGVNPVYNDGVLSLKNNKSTEKIVPVDFSYESTEQREYEEKEFQIDFEDECEA